MAQVLLPLQAPRMRVDDTVLLAQVLVLIIEQRQNLALGDKVLRVVLASD